MSPLAVARRKRALTLLDLHAGDAVLDIGSGICKPFAVYRSLSALLRLLP